MLLRLTVNNYALIEELDVEFSAGLSIITGETGAGKSILLGALGLILGERADTKALFSGKKKCIVEGSFDIRNYRLQDFFSENALDYDDLTHIRREISADGKSRAFINDTPVILAQLKELSSRLVDIHSQHETLTLNDSGFQLSVVDAFAGTEKAFAAYTTGYYALQQQQTRLNELLAQEAQTLKETDYLQFLFNELEEAALVPGEQETLEQELQTLEHAEQIKSGLEVACHALSEGESNLLSQFTSLTSTLTPLTRFSDRIGALSERLKSATIELKDIASELSDASEDIRHNPQRVEEINDRLNTLYRLQQKHRVSTTEALLAIKEDTASKLASFNSLAQETEDLRAQIGTLLKKLSAEAIKISAARNKAIPGIEKKIKEMLGNVGMPNAIIKIENIPGATDSPGKNGIDHLRFLFSANKGVEYRELNKVASGGELSRLMLCIKALVASLTALPTIIFDEIDTGISGEVALKVGSLMQEIAKAHQVIAITHLPQIAGKGNAHFVVYKELAGSATLTKMRPLNNDERITEIAKMISGQKPTAAAIESARELLRSS